MIQPLLSIGIPSAGRSHWLSCLLSCELSQDAFVVHRHNLDEVCERRIEGGQHLGGDGRVGLLVVRLDVRAQGCGLFRCIHRLQRHHLHVAPPRELLLRVVDVCDATAHAGAKVDARLSEAHNAAARHVLAAVVANPLHHRQSTRVAHAEALATFAAEEGLPRGGTIERDVAHHHVVLSDEPRGQLGLVRVHDDLSSRQPLPTTVVRVALDLHRHSLSQREAERLPRVPVEVHMDRAVGQPHAAVPFGNFVGEHGANGAVSVVDYVGDAHGGAVLERGHRLLDEAVVQDSGEPRRVGREVVLSHRVELRLAGGERRGGREDRAEVERRCLGMQGVLVHAEHVGAANHLLHRAEAQHRHVLAHLLREQPQEVDHVLRLAGKLLAQLGVLRSDAHGAGVEVALAHHDAPQRDEGHRGEAELLRAKHRGDGHVTPRLELPVGLQDDPRAKLVEDERLVRLGEAELPRQARVLDPRPRCRARAAVAAGDHDVVRLALGDTRGDHADANLGDELDGDARRAVGRLEVVDQLREVLDRIDVVVRRRRDQPDAARGAACLRDQLGHLAARQLAALPGLRALRHLDLQLVRVGQVVGGDAEPAGGDLLDGGAPFVEESLRVFAALASVRLTAELVHRERERLVCFDRDRAERHGACAESLHYVGHRLHLVD
mmetsp:Transcript_43738/g.106159  ORF Transcript_43738/g.106159 Transcript_43738/m.106159 type:complete len:663 (-) Transcript_43738:1140-3128(-)